jgi:hypothetical protein
MKLVCCIDHCPEIVQGGFVLRGMRRVKCKKPEGLNPQAFRHVSGLTEHGWAAIPVQMKLAPHEDGIAEAGFSLFVGACQVI